MSETQMTDIIRMQRNGTITIPNKIRSKMDMDTGDIFLAEYNGNGTLVLKKAQLLESDST